jgi:hypothetical protein
VAAATRSVTTIRGVKASRAWIAVLGVALTVSTGDALAKAPPPKAKNLSAISQYRESIPTAAGPAFPSAEPVAKAPLPAPVEEKVAAEGGPAAPALVKTATDPRLGAPRKKLPRIRPKEIVRPRPQGVPGAVFRAPGRLVTDGQSGRMLGLGVFVLVVAAAGAAAGYRRAT